MHVHATSRSWFTLVTAVAVWFFAANLHAVAAEAVTSSISVSGTGQAEGPPDAAEIVLTATGTGELTGDAIAKFRSSVKQTVDACKSLGIKNLSIKEEGFTLGPAAPAAGGNAFAIQAQQNAAVKTQMSLSRNVTLSLSEIGKTPENELLETLGRIVDTAKDAGAALAGGGAVGGEAAVIRAMMGGGAAQSSVVYVIADAKPLRQQAYQNAFAEAQARAEILAKLAGKKLGGVVTLGEGLPPAPDNPAGGQVALMRAIYGIAETAKNRDRLTADKFGPISVAVTLNVTFELK